MQTLSNYIDNLIAEIAIEDDLESYLVDKTMYIAFITIIILFILYEHLISTQRESLMATLNLNPRWQLTPILGDSAYGYKLGNGLAFIYVVLKYVVRAFQIYLIGRPFEIIIRYLFNFIENTIYKTNLTLEFEFKTKDYLLVLLASELIILFINIFLNIKCISNIINNKIAAFFLSILPIPGYFITNIIIKAKKITYKNVKENMYYEDN